MIEQGSRWSYFGDDGSPQGLSHTVMQAGKQQIVTWSDPVDNLAGVGGYSWLGPVGQFLKEFKRIP